ncbi:hypothetical protein BN1723_018743, partial [Verticillium longisporum]
MILKKYTNSLGRHFDAPDLTLRIFPREERQERLLGPEEPMGRTIDAYFPGGQTRAREADSYVDAKWVYAVVVGALSALTALLFMVPFILRFAFTFVWDFVLFVLWLVAFGIFGH